MSSHVFTQSQRRLLPLLGFLALLAAVALSCAARDGAGKKRRVAQEGVCVIATDGDATEGEEGTSSVEYLTSIGCTADFEALASEPLDMTLPGARSTKIVLDQADHDALYFQNSVLYQVHYAFASTHLSGGDLPTVPSLSEFNTTEYYSPTRRFILGAITHYEGPQVWALELSPYDTASVALITKLYRRAKAQAFFGPALYFHPTSSAIATLAKGLPADIPLITTNDLYAETDYQPLTLSTAIGRLQFITAAELETTYVSYESILVLDIAPNDISVVQGLITEEFQTPLSHINVLSANRHTPNMGLRKARRNALLRSLEGKLIELTVAAKNWSVREVTQAEALAFWAAHKPVAVTLPTLDFTVKDLYDIADVTPEPAAESTLREAIKNAVHAFGGKAAQYSVLARTEKVPVAKAFAIPVYYYEAFMRENGYFDRIDALLADPQFVADSSRRDTELALLREAMMHGTINPTLQALLRAKLALDFPEKHVMRFRTSTNSEDLEGFPCAGCYESHSGDPNDWDDVLNAIRQTYASAWLFRSFEERSYYGIDHKTVGMALLVHRNFPNEAANGVAVTANPFDASGLDPAFYINVQYGGAVEVVHPQAGITSDQLLYYFNQPNQPITYLDHSSLVADGATVLSAAQIHSLGVALDAIHERFNSAYGPASGNTGWYAMDVEFKFDAEADPSATPTLYIKQARPYPGRGNE